MYSKLTYRVTSNIDGSIDYADTLIFNSCIEIKRRKVKGELNFNKEYFLNRVRNVNTTENS